MKLYLAITIFVFASCSANIISSSNTTFGSESKPKEDRPSSQVLLSEWSSLAKLQLPPDNIFETCYASLISNYWLVTSGDCVNKTAVNTNELKVLFQIQGSPIQNEAEKNTQKFEKFDVEQVVVHSKYSVDQVSANIALIKLKDSAPSHVKRLPFQDKTKSRYTTCETAGWCAHQSRRNTVKQLVVISVPTVWHFKRTVERPGHKSVVEYNDKLLLGLTPALISNANSGGRKSGDDDDDKAGSSLICRITEGENKGKKLLRGILLSWIGRMCDQEEFLQIYVNVSKFEDWIYKTITDF